GKYDLSKTWMNKNHDEVIQISDNIINYFTNIRHARSTEQAWTTFTTHFSQLKKKGTIKSFVPLTGKLEEYDKRNNLVFAANCFPNSFIKQKINENKTVLDDGTYALSILLGLCQNIQNLF
ncbi:MAG: yonV1, partial [Haloplasmataceae bacterium]|nr:yonV1 [Haloplasmataceae bacterium]